MKNKRVTFFIFMMLCSYFGKAQHISWLSGLGGSLNEGEQKVCRDSDENYYVAIQIESSFPIFSDYTDTVNLTNSSSQGVYIAKYNNYGILQWLKCYSSNGSFEPCRIICDNSQNIILVGIIDNSILIQTNTYNSVNGKLAIIKIDKNGNFINSLQVPNSAASYGYIKLVSDQLNNTYVSDIYTIKSYMPDFNERWLITLPNNYRVNDIFFEKGFLYTIGTSTGAFVFLGNNISAPIGNSDIVISKMDTNGNLIWIKKYGGTSAEIATFIRVQGNRLIFTAYFLGATTIGTKTINSTGTAPNTLIAFGDTSGNFYYINRIGGNGSLVAQAYDASIFNTYFYLTGIVEENIPFGIGNNRIIIHGNPGYADMFIAKMDSASNFLSVVEAHSKSAQGNGMTIDKNGNTILTGYFNDSMQIINMKMLGRGYTDMFLVKIEDLSITKGVIANHPYCAGDSIAVSYSIKGEYRTGNHFTAQLSDRYGSFDSVFYTLGSDSSTQGGIISGRIPDTLITSTNYSIRVIADNPAVVSFADNITFNISQKPIAKAGSDTLICFGQSLQLGDSNSSATQYRWKPFLFMNDSTVKFPYVKPDTSVTYILTATNNCSAYDTVVVNVRKPLSFAQLHDTVFCKTDTLLLQPTLIGGNILQQKLNIFKLPDTLSFATNDSLMHIHFVPDTSIAYRLGLSDGCSIPFSDTFNLRLRVPLNITVSNDTLVCRGLPLQLSVNGWQTDSAAYQFNWSYKPARLSGGNTFLSDSSIINIISDSSMKFLLKSKYVCVNKTDSHFVNINVLPRLQLKLTTDTSMCFGNSYSVTATANGGDTLHYKFKWENLNDSTIFVDSNYKSVTHLFTPLQTVTYQLKLSDGCTIPIDSSQVKITVYPKIQAGFTVDDSIQCLDTNNFLFTDTSFIASGTYNRYWTLGDATTNTSSSFNKSYNASGNYFVQLKIVESNSCSDSATHSVIVKQNPIKPQILSVTTTQIQSTFSANNYTWFLNNVTIVNSNSQIIYLHQNGKYFVKVDSANDCSNSSDPINITLYTNSQVLVYPNPNDGNFTIDFIELPGIKKVDMFDMQEKFITSFSTSENIVQVNTDHILARGMYLLKVETLGGTFVVKVVVE